MFILLIPIYLTLYYSLTIILETPYIPRLLSEIANAISFSP